MDVRSWPDTQRWLDHDRRLAEALNRASSYRALLYVCRVVSRLADGVIWYALIAMLPLIAGQAGWRCARHMLIAGLISLTIYKVLKVTTCRLRPYESCPNVQLCGRVLDQFSFPSGHTFHAVGFSLVLTYHFPMIAVAAIPFTMLVALSRVVLGLHYPSDVLAGAACGALVGLASVFII